MKKILFLCTFLVGLSACSSPTAPLFKMVGVEEFNPDTFHYGMWHKVKDCIGEENVSPFRTFEAVTWYLAYRLYKEDDNGEVFEAAGLYSKTENAIYILRSLKYDGIAVSHEINHALGLVEHNAPKERFVCEFEDL